MSKQRTVRAWVDEQVDKLALQHPARIALGAFSSVILLFTGLLSLPAATMSGQRAPFIDALFTSTSAVCVTGLVTVDTGSYWSPTGLTIIAVAIKVGGLGIMTLASIVGLAVSRRLGLTQRILAAGEARATGLGDLRSLLKTIIIVSTSAEVIIALVLFPRFLTLDYGLGKSAGFSVFYALAAFNNAGFSPDPLGLTPYAADAWILAPLGLGVFVGALGFPVYLNILREWRHPRRWTLHTKLTLITIMALAVVSAAFLALFEWGNPDTLGPANSAKSFGNILFQSINQRSGGFSSFDIGEARDHTWLLEIVLMFIGGACGAVACDLGRGPGTARYRGVWQAHRHRSVAPGRIGHPHEPDGGDPRHYGVPVADGHPARPVALRGGVRICHLWPQHRHHGFARCGRQSHTYRDDDCGPRRHLDRGGNASVTQAAACDPLPEGKAHHWLT
jgi:trk system potassium uptake protein TrkH